MTDELTRRELLQVTAVTAAAVAAGPALAAPAEKTTAAGYIVQRLKQHGVGQLFGVPGATCDPLFAAAAATMNVVVTSSDLEAGYAADGCARVKGLSAVAVTYGVGTMGLLSVVGGAYAERSPMLIFNGGPSAEDLKIQRELGSYFSHSIGRDQTDLAVFKEVTETAERAEKAADVPRVVDAAIRTALMKQRPAYVEIPKHLWDAAVPAPGGPIDLTVAASDQTALATEIVQKLRAAQRPAVLLGIELQRYGLQDAALALVQKLGLPYATTLLAKSVIDEKTEGFVGVHLGDRSPPAVKKLIEDSDGLLVLGAVLGRQYRKLVTQSLGACVIAANDTVRVGKKPAVKAALGPLIAALQQQDWKPPAKAAPIAAVAPKPPAFAEAGLTYDQVIAGLNGVLDDSFLAVTDTSLSMYPAAALEVSGRGAFVCNAVWQSIGFSVAAAVGIGLAQARRPLVLCGDGGFQMTAMALSTMAQRKLRAIVVVLDNGTYGIEQWLLDPSYFAAAGNAPKPYLGLNRWKYAELAKALGVGTSAAVETEAELAAALKASVASSGPAFIAVKIRPHDLPSGLRT